jgi:hypothetical protein
VNHVLSLTYITMNRFEKKLLMSAATKAMDYIQLIEQRNVAPSRDALENLSAFDEDLPVDGTDALHNLDFWMSLDLLRQLLPTEAGTMDLSLVVLIRLRLRPTGWLVHGIRIQVSRLPAPLTPRLRQWLKNGLPTFYLWRKDRPWDL